MTQTTKPKNTTVTLYGTYHDTINADNADSLAWYKDTKEALKSADDGDTLYRVTFEKVANIKLQLVPVKEVTE
jgi:hypothetical protein